MLKYFIVQLCDTSPSFCHYPNSKTQPRLIALDTLRDAIHMAMCENLLIQFLYPPYPLPDDYVKLIESIDHAKIAPAASNVNADIKLIDSVEDTKDVTYGDTICIRMSRQEFAQSTDKIASLLRKAQRLNISLTDPHTATDADLKEYADALQSLIPVIVEEYEKNRYIQFNLLTDRLMLSSMNNCNAGYESITIAPDGNFYICPAFYLEGDRPVGNITDGIHIPNSQLLRPDHAPICRNCDAFQCRRCVWLNRLKTLEFNTPSRGQCIMAHTSREASRLLGEKLSLIITSNSLNSISELDYIDPFEKISR